MTYQRPITTHRPKGGGITAAGGTEKGTEWANNHGLLHAEPEKQRSQQSGDQVVQGEVCREPNREHLDIVVPGHGRLPVGLDDPLDTASFHSRDLLQTVGKSLEGVQFRGQDFSGAMLNVP